MASARPTGPASPDGRAGGPADAVAKLERALGHQFKAPDLLEQALTHGSMAGGRPSRRKGAAVASRAGGYERLEFLGDRVLGLVIADMLWHRFPEEAEGDLARRFVYLVRQETLSEIGSGLGIARHVRVAAGALTEAVVADVVEALIAALYLDGGLAAAAGFVERLWAPRIEAAESPPIDPKTELQEWVQGRGLPLPAYRLVASAGPAHKPVFTVAVAVGDLPPATADGSSKRQAEALAAAVLLKRIRS